MNALGEPPSQIGNKRVSVVAVTLANYEIGNQLSFGINGNEGPDIAIISRAGGVFVFCPNKTPYFVHLQMVAFKIAHLVVHDGFAAFTDTNAQTHDGVPVNTRHALNGADAAALAKHGDRQHFLFGFQFVHGEIIHGFQHVSTKKYTDDHPCNYFIKIEYNIAFRC